MTYRVDFTTAAARQLRAIDTPMRRRLLRALSQLEDDPRPSGVRKLSGQDAAWRIRVGDYRVIYEIQDASLVVVVFRVAHRREVYR